MHFLLVFLIAFARTGAHVIYNTNAYYHNPRLNARSMVSNRAPAAGVARSLNNPIASAASFLNPYGSLFKSLLATAEGFVNSFGRNFEPAEGALPSQAREDMPYEEEEENLNHHEESPNQHDEKFLHGSHAPRVHMGLLRQGNNYVTQTGEYLGPGSPFGVFRKEEQPEISSPVYHGTQPLDERGAKIFHGSKHFQPERGNSRQGRQNYHHQDDRYYQPHRHPARQQPSYRHSYPEYPQDSYSHGPRDVSTRYAGSFKDDFIEEGANRFADGVFSDPGSGDDLFSDFGNFRR